MVFAICTGLRLARFNVMIDDPEKPAWAGNFFVGVPAPAGAITVLLPIYACISRHAAARVCAAADAHLHACRSVPGRSRLPVLSGKRVGKRVAPEMVLPTFLAVVLFFALLVAYPWEVLTLGTLLYLSFLPVGFASYRKYKRRDEAQAASARASMHSGRQRSAIAVAAIGASPRGGASRAPQLTDPIWVQRAITVLRDELPAAKFAIARAIFGRRNRRLDGISEVEIAVADEPQIDQRDVVREHLARNAIIDYGERNRTRLLSGSGKRAS